jgi:hypothetical protein
MKINKMVGQTRVFDFLGIGEYHLLKFKMASNAFCNFVLFLKLLLKKKNQNKTDKM